MKTTFDLPEQLVHQLKVRAAQQKRRVKDLAAEYIQAGLTEQANGGGQPAQPEIVIDKETGIPMLKSSGPAPHAAEMTPERIKDILLEQEVEWALEASRR